MQSLILFFVAIVLFMVLAPIGLLFELVVMIFRFRINRNRFNQFFRTIAISIDQLGNVVCASLFNATLITKASFYHFGDEDDTISEVIGRNKLAGTLSRMGKWLDGLLDWIDPNHSIKALDD